MKFILGKKMSMTQIWVQDKAIAVTPVSAGPCVVTQVKTKAKDGYEALQLAYGERKEKNINKPQLSRFKKLGLKPAHVREFRLAEAGNFQVSDVISAGTFAVGDIVDVTGTSKGKGFQGVVKRHHFAGFRATHGNKDQERMSGSVAPKGPAHVFKGTRMGGRMGGERVTTTNVEIVALDPEKDIIYIKGSVPGATNGLVLIQGQGELKANLKKEVQVVESEPTEKSGGEEKEETEKGSGEEAKEEIKDEAASA